MQAVSGAIPVSLVFASWAPHNAPVLLGAAKIPECAKTQHISLYHYQLSHVMRKCLFFFKNWHPCFQTVDNFDFPRFLGHVWI